MKTLAQIDISNMEPDLVKEIKTDLKIVDYLDDDGTGEWYVVRKLGAIIAVDDDGTPIIVLSHETAYRVGYNIGLYDCLWWCPVRVEDYAEKYGVDKEE